MVVTVVYGSQLRQQRLAWTLRLGMIPHILFGTRSRIVIVLRGTYDGWKAASHRTFPCTSLGRFETEVAVYTGAHSRTPKLVLRFYNFGETIAGVWWVPIS